MTAGDARDDIETRWQSLHDSVKRVREASEMLTPRTVSALERAHQLKSRLDRHPTKDVVDRPGGLLRERLRELEHEVEGLHTAMATRAVIEQAKGMIMMRDRCDAETAFQTLVKTSQHSHRKLHDIAELVVEWGCSDRSSSAPSADVSG